MAMADLTVTVELKRRPLWSLILRTPLLWLRHYRVFRRDGAERIVAVYAAWILASHVVTFAK